MSKRSAPKGTWQTFLDLQCPYSRNHWMKRKEIEAKFADNYDITYHLTSLAFHPQAFFGQKAAMLVEVKKGKDDKMKFIDACYQNQTRFMNDAIGDARPSEVNAVFADIAQEAGLLDKEDGFTREYFLEHVNNFDMTIKPASVEHKYALTYGVFGTPKFVIDDKLIAGTESSWGPDEWEEKLKEIKPKTENDNSGDS